MKQVYILLILSFLFLGTVSGQSPTQLYSTEKTTVGTSLPTGHPITATRYIVPEKIYKWYWDGVSENLLLELRELDPNGISYKNNGTLQMVDLDTKNVKWTWGINYKASEIKQRGRHYFLTEKKKNLCIHPETGVVQWENKNDFYYIDPYLDIGIGYPLRSTSNKLTAVDLSNGKELWKKHIDRRFGWDDAYMLTDSTLLISTNGIKAVNLANGKGWTYQASTNKKKIGQMIAVNVVGIILGLLTDTYFFQSQPNVASDMVSNMLIDPNGNIIHASRNKISRIDRFGNVKWTTSLPKNITSKSSLFLVDSVVYMINRGYALYNGAFSMVGDPYLAAFDLHSGRQKYLVRIPEKKDFIRNYQAVNDLLFIVFDDKISSYRLSDGSFITDRTLEMQENESLDAFVESGIYWKQNNGILTDLASYFSNNNLMMTTEGKVFVLTDNLETAFIFGKEDLYRITIDSPRYALISNNDSDFIVLDELDKPVASLKATPEMFLYQDHLYFFDKDSFTEIDLNRLHQSPTVWDSIFRQVLRYTRSEK